MNLKHLFSLSHCVCPLLHATSHLGAKRAGDAAVTPLPPVLSAAGAAAEGGGEITQPHLLPTLPRSVHRKWYNLFNSTGQEENATIVLPLWFLCLFQS